MLSRSRCSILARGRKFKVITKPTIVELPAFTVVGIAARTNNAKEAASDGIIGRQWHRFMSEQLLEKIPGKVSSEIYGVYTEYASDANDDYTLVLGAKVQGAADNLPSGMVKAVIPQTRFAVFTSGRGPVAKVVVETWQNIWSYFQSEENEKRAYQADFELYDQRAADPDKAQVDIYIGLK